MGLAWGLGSASKKNGPKARPADRLQDPKGCHTHFTDGTEAGPGPPSRLPTARARLREGLAAGPCPPAPSPQPPCQGHQSSLHSNCGSSP